MELSKEFCFPLCRLTWRLLTAQRCPCCNQSGRDAKFICLQEHEVILELSLILLSPVMEELLSCSCFKERQVVILGGRTMWGAARLPAPRMTRSVLPQDVISSAQVIFIVGDITRNEMELEEYVTTSSCRGQGALFNGDWRLGQLIQILLGCVRVVIFTQSS